MATIVWTEEAAALLGLIREYIEQFDPVASRLVADRIIESTKRLEDYPESGRPADHPFRELVTVRPYILKYRIDGDTVFIVSVRHAAQRAD